MSADVAVHTRGLVKRFGRFTAVDGIDLDVERGAIFGFLGANGAGKTTAIRMLCGLLKPSGGVAVVDGVDVVRRPERVKSRIGYMAQKFSLYDDLTVDENIRFFADAYLVPRKRLADRRDHVLRSTDLVGQDRIITKTLPVGIKQRLALACALVHEPRVLFLDEPTAGVDPLSRRSVLAPDPSPAHRGRHHLRHHPPPRRGGELHRGAVHGVRALGRAGASPAAPRGGGSG